MSLDIFANAGGAIYAVRALAPAMSLAIPNIYTDSIPEGPKIRNLDGLGTEINIPVP